MSSSRHTRKFMKTISKFQKICLQNKSAYEGSETKNFSWLPFGWSRASYQENFDGLNDTFNSTGIVADSIFVYANPEAETLQKEKVLLSSNSKCPAQRMLEQQTTHSHPKLKDLYRRRCGLPVDANEVKNPLTDEQKKFIEKLKRCPNSPPTLDKFQATVQEGYSHVKTNVSLPGNAEMVSELPYWVKGGSGGAVQSRLPSEGAIDLRSPAAFMSQATKGEVSNSSQLEDVAYNLPNLRSSWAENSENVTTSLPEDGNFDLRNPPTYGTLTDIDMKTCQIDNTSPLQTQNVFRTPPKSVSNKMVRFFSSSSIRSKGEKEKCQKLPSNVPPPSSQGKCAKVKATGCGSRARENCNPIIKERTPCEKLEPPFASYSECLKDPTPPAKASECPRKDNGFPEHCRKPNEGLSIDGCNPPPPKELGQCKPRKRAPPRSNACDEEKGGCPDIKPFKNASSSAPSPISCPPTSMSSRILEPESLRATFCTSKRFFSSKGSSNKPPKSKKKRSEPVDWLNSESPNACKKRSGKCDPKIKPFRNEAAPPPPPVKRHSAPIITRVGSPSDLINPQVPPKRFYSTVKNTKGKDEKPKKPCFEPKKIKPKGGLTEDDLHSRVSCVKKPDDISGNRCEKAKCGPESIPCKKPLPINQHRCPKKPVYKRKKKVRVVVGPKVLLGYKVCDKPPQARPFQCKPKQEQAKKRAKEAPTPKRCPCFAPMDFDQQAGSTCRKMPNAVEPNCNKPSAKDSEPTGKCQKKEGC